MRTDLAWDSQRSGTYAYASAQHDFVYDWLPWFPDEEWTEHAEIHYSLLADGRPWSVRTRAWMDISGVLPPDAAILNGWAYSQVHGSLKITGGRGTAIVQMLLNGDGYYSFGVFDLPVEMVFAQGGQSPDRGEFRFGQPFTYMLETRAQMSWENIPRDDFDAPPEGFLEIAGIVVTDLEGRAIPGTRLLSVETPEPSTLLLAAAGLALLALRRRA